MDMEAWRLGEKRKTQYASEKYENIIFQISRSKSQNPPFPRDTTSILILI
jgi:hypothetical protein